MYTGTIALLVGSSGSGKGMLMKRAKKLHPNIVFPLSTTTRTPRPQELHGTHYHFITNEEFNALKADGAFLEWACIDGEQYGTRASDVLPVLEAGEIAMKEMDIQGVHKILEVLPRENVVTIYVDAGNWETLSRRIQGRAPIQPEELESRRKRYEVEKNFRKEADYVIENPDGKFKEADAAFEDVVKKLLAGAL